MRKPIIALLIATWVMSAPARAQSPAALKRIDSLTQASSFEAATLLLDQLYQQAGTSDQKSQLLNKKAEILIAQGLLQRAESTLQNWSALGVSSNTEEANYLTNLGFLNLNKGRQDLALEHLRKAFDLLQAAGRNESREGAKCLSYLSLTYFATGKYNQAAENATIALQINQRIFGEESEEVAASYNDLGLVYSRINPDQALEYYDKALPIYQKVHGDEHAKIAIINSNTAAIYRQLKLYGDAITNFEMAQKIWHTLYPNGHPNEAFVLRNLGQTYISMGNRSTAYQYFDRALAAYRKVYGTTHPDISSLLNQIAALQISDQQYEKALATLQSAIQSNVPSYSVTDYYRPTPLNSYYNGNELLYSLQQKAKAFEGLHFGRTLKLTDLEAALDNLLLCDSLIDDIRHHRTDEGDKLSLGTLANEVYEDGVRIALSVSEAKLKPRAFQEIAFYFAEKSKSAVLQESIADSQAKSFAGIPIALVEEEKELKSTIAFLSQRLSQKPSEEEEKYLRETLFQLNLDYDRFTKNLEKDYPNYFNLKFNYTSPSVDQIQSMLKDRQAIVSFFVAEDGNRIYQFLITRKKFAVRNLTLPDGFDRLTKGFVNGIYYRNFDSYAKTSRALGRVLIPKVPQNIQEVILIPSGRLGTLPFEALPVKIGADFASTTFLVDRLAISYEFSAGLILQKQKTVTRMEKPSIFLCAPVQFPEKDNLNDLPGTEKEVSDIAGLFNASNKEVSTRLDANESLVKSGKLGSYNYLHFATHGVVDELDPDQSRIFLNTTDHEDGNLFAGEIYNLSLNADLTVLSACQTGLGKFSKGEGVIGLSRALVYAGARNLIVSFWSVADESTASLMADFYSILLKQPVPDFSKALREAKKKMINENTFREPYYWAPFVLIGY